MGSKKRTMRGRKQRGGQAPVNDSSMLSPSSSSLAQGIDYKQIHMGQHGGAAPVESLGATLPQELQGPAAVTSTMNAFRDIQGMSDQTGGARRRGRGTKRSKRSLKLYGGNYKMYGGVGCKMYGGKRRGGTKRRKAKKWFGLF